MELLEQIRSDAPEGQQGETFLDSDHETLRQEMELIQEDIWKVSRKNRSRRRKVGIVCVAVILIAAGRMFYLYETLNAQCETKIEAYQKSLEKD